MEQTSHAVAWGTINKLGPKVARHSVPLITNRFKPPPRQFASTDQQLNKKLYSSTYLSTKPLLMFEATDYASSKQLILQDSIHAQKTGGNARGCGLCHTKTLVLGIATTYKWRDVAHFVISLRRTGFSGDIALLLEKKWLDKEDYAQFFRFGVTPVEVFPILSRIPEIIRRYRFSKPAFLLHRYARLLVTSKSDAFKRIPWLSLTHTWFHPVMSARFFIYRNLIEELGNDYSHFILSDVRDVVFQCNPDRWHSQSPVNFFLESPRATVSAEPTNARWIRRMYGDTALGRFAAARVSCAGVFHATRVGLMDYLDKMTEELARQTEVISGENGFDQGVHNFLLHSGCFPSASIWENGEGLALNMQGLLPNEWTVNEEGMVCTPYGTVIPMIHQYDRHPALKESIARKFQI